MHTHHHLVADALLRERQIHRQQRIHLTHHLSDGVRTHRLRHHLARALVRLARAVEPGVAMGPVSQIRA